VAYSDRQEKIFNETIGATGEAALGGNSLRKAGERNKSRRKRLENNSSGGDGDKRVEKKTVGPKHSGDDKKRDKMIKKMRILGKSRELDNGGRHCIERGVSQWSGMGGPVWGNSRAGRAQLWGVIRGEGSVKKKKKKKKKSEMIGQGRANQRGGQ